MGKVYRTYEGAEYSAPEMETVDMGIESSVLAASGVGEDPVDGGYEDDSADLLNFILHSLNW